MKKPNIDNAESHCYWYSEKQAALMAEWYASLPTIDGKKFTYVKESEFGNPGGFDDYVLIAKGRDWIEERGRVKPGVFR